MRCRVIVYLLLIVMFLVGPSKAQTPYQEWLRQQQEQYQAYRQEETNRYREFLRADSLAFAQFRNDVMQKWDLFVSSTKKDWVEYDDNLNSRTIVDFDQGLVTVELLVPQEDAELPEHVDRRVADAVQKLIENRGTTMDYEVAEQKPEPLSAEPILSEQVKTAEGEAVTTINAAEFGYEIVQRRGIKKTAVESRDGEKRIKASLTFPLVPDHLRIRAQKFLADVQKCSSRYNLDVRLVFAVMHTESYFNPKAKSTAPAYGLMQLVPTSGGRDAHAFVFGDDIPPSPNFLYNPGNNIELGCAYLHLLETRYFRQVADRDVLRWCVISAYNTGPGNVSRAITGERNLKEAMEILNRMEQRTVRDKLMRDLPYQETKDYLAKVEERIPLYAEWQRETMGASSR